MSEHGSRAVLPGSDFLVLGRLLVLLTRPLLLLAHRNQVRVVTGLSWPENLFQDGTVAS